MLLTLLYYYLCVCGVSTLTLLYIIVRERSEPPARRDTEPAPMPPMTPEDFNAADLDVTDELIEDVASEVLATTR
jgi:hypothetical protein